MVAKGEELAVPKHYDDDRSIGKNKSGVDPQNYVQSTSRPSSPGISMAPSFISDENTPTQTKIGLLTWVCGRRVTPYVLWHHI